MSPLVHRRARAKHRGQDFDVVQRLPASAEAVELHHRSGDGSADQGFGRKSVVDSTGENGESDLSSAFPL